MKQVIIIHGGSSFATPARYREHLQNLTLDYDRLKKKDRWSNWIADQLSEADVLLPSFPNSASAQYEEWKIYFEKIIPFFTDDVTLIGHSLGAMFLAKYLHESPLKNPVRKLILVAPGYDDDSLEDLGSFDVVSAADLEASANEIHLFHSTDDPVVPFTELAKFQTDLPHATSHIFEDRGHFTTATFPELLSIIKQK